MLWLVLRLSVLDLPTLRQPLLLASRVTGVVYPQFSSTAVEGSASQVVGSLPLGEVFAAPVFHQVHQEQFAGGEIPETLLLAEEFTEPVFTAFHQEQSSAGDTTENFAIFPVVLEQVLVQAFPRLVGSSPLVDEFTAYVARRPLTLVEVQPFVRAQRHFVEQLADIAPMVQILDGLEPQMVVQLLEVFRLLDTQLPDEQAVFVPKISCFPFPSRSRVPEPQSADQLVEVLTVLTPTRIAVQIAEQIVDTPVHLPEFAEWVQLRVVATSGPYFWDRHTRETMWKPLPASESSGSARRGLEMRSGTGTKALVPVRMTSLLFLLSEELHRQPRAVYKYWAPLLSTFFTRVAKFMAEFSCRPRQVDGDGAAKGRRLRRLRSSWWRHEQQTVAAVLATVTHHSFGRERSTSCTTRRSSGRLLSQLGAGQHLCLRLLAGRDAWSSTFWKISAPCRFLIFLCCRWWNSQRKWTRSFAIPCLRLPSRLLKCPSLLFLFVVFNARLCLSRSWWNSWWKCRLC